MKVRRGWPIWSFILVVAVMWSGCGTEDLVGPPAQQNINPKSPPPVIHAAPPGYYDTVDPSNPAALRQTLHAVIDDHTRFPYTSSSTDTWDILELADEDPTDASRIVDIYLNASYPKAGGGNTNYNREHSWPKSYGFPNDVSTNYPYTDCHALFLCDSGYNTSRSNKPYRFCDGTCTEKPTQLTNGEGGGSGTYPGNSNWTSGSFTSGTWETWVGRRGDVARALLYLDVRYEGGTHGVTGAAEPDLVLTDDEALIAASNTGSNESVAYMGMLSVLLQWHQQDPVDDRERARNDVVFGFQGNRNPFIDHPEWIDCVFSGTCGDATPPAAPTGLVAVGGDGQVDLDWNDNTEPDLAGYNVYRATDAAGPFTAINAALVTASTFTDTGVSNGTTYWYKVTAVDASANESAQSAAASATPSGGPPVAGAPWINEFHYDNTGTDTGEFVEVAGPAGTDLTGWTVVGYNGNGGGTYKTVTLSGTLADQQGGFGTASFAFSAMQNGTPDGLALVDASGAVVEFLSYEGTLVATNGPAAGMTSTDVGVAESSGTPVGWSLQRVGSGSSAADFTWQAPAADSPGSPNAGQTFGGGGTPDTTPPVPPTGLVAMAGDGQVDLDWDDNGEPDLAGYNVQRSTSPGGPYTTLNASLLAASLYTDGTVQNGTTYYYVVTAVDASGNESGASGEVSATPQDMTPPAAPTGLVATAGDARVDLDWADNGEPDLDGYDVLRATSPGGPYTSLTPSPVAASQFADLSVSNGTTYYYVVRAVDLTGNASGNSAEASATPQAPGGGGSVAVWINEFHYDNSGKDKNEFVEVAGTAGTDLSGWTLVGYNGGNGTAYKTVNLSGTIPSQQAGLGTVAFDFKKLQNGAPDGIALVDDQGNVVEFLSYEGSFTASDGPAAGMASTDVGVSEASSTPKNWSLQRTGTGSAAADFTWQGPMADTPDQPNTGQTFVAGFAFARSGAD